MNIGKDPIVRTNCPVDEQQTRVCIKFRFAPTSHNRSKYFFTLVFLCETETLGYAAKYRVKFTNIETRSENDSIYNWLIQPGRGC